MEEKRNNLTLGEMLILMRDMVDSFICEHELAWDKYREAYKEEHGFDVGRSLSLHSYIGSDLLIDFAYLAKAVESGVPFERECWVRSQGVQNIVNDEDRDINRRVWSDVVGKFRYRFDGKLFQDVEWFQDEDCKIDNKFVEKDILKVRYI